MERELTAFLAACPDLHITLEDKLAEEDRVATRVTMHGTHRGALFGVPTSGKPVVMKAHHILRLEAGLIVQQHGQMDRLELMWQIGTKLVVGGCTSGALSQTVLSNLGNTVWDEGIRWRKPHV